MLSYFLGSISLNVYEYLWKEESFIGILLKELAKISIFTYKMTKAKSQNPQHQL